MNKEKSLPTSNSFEKEPITFIIFLRGVAVFLIYWAHLASWLDTWEVSWLPMDFIRNYFTEPLGIIQDFGFMGVSLLFLITGFIITHIAQVEKRKEFAIKRLFRIYPPLIVSIILIVAFYGIYGLITQSYIHIQNFTSLDILVSFTLANYLMVPQYVVNGVAWILVVIGIFYLSCFIILPLLKKRPKTSIVSLISFSIITIILSKSFGSSFFLFAVSVSHVPFLIIGQIFYYWWKKKLSNIESIVFSIIAYFVSVQGLLIVNPDFYLSVNSYEISFVYACLVFFIALLLNERIRVGRILGFYSKISYSFFLNNGITTELISFLFPLLGFSPSLGISFLLSTTVAYISWHYIEIPFRTFSRKIVNHLD